MHSAARGATGERAGTKARSGFEKAARKPAVKDPAAIATATRTKKSMHPSNESIAPLSDVACDARIKIAYLHDPVKWNNPKYPNYPKPDVADRLRTTAMQLCEITAKDVLSGRLTGDGFNVLLVPGGFAPHFTDALGDAGEAIIRRFVRAGGGYVGLCAGAYYGVWSELIRAEIIDIEHWNRGQTNQCELRWTAAGVEGVNAPDTSFVRYHNGPLLRATGAGCHSYCDFVTELRGKKGTFPPCMAGASAVLHGKCGNGHVVLVSPHIESNTDAPTTTLFCNLFRLAASGSVPLGGGTEEAVGVSAGNSEGSSTRPEGAPVQLIFAYGSLRPDDDSGMAWTAEFARGMTARRASLGHARLYEDDFASVVLGGNSTSEDRVIGYALGCADATRFAAKLREADQIEGWDPDAGGLYERAIVDVAIDETGEMVRAYIYHRPDCCTARHIASGDWMKRQRARGCVAGAFTQRACERCQNLLMPPCECCVDDDSGGDDDDDDDGSTDSHTEEDREDSEGVGDVNAGDGPKDVLPGVDSAHQVLLDERMQASAPAPGITASGVADPAMSSTTPDSDATAVPAAPLPHNPHVPIRIFAASTASKAPPAPKPTAAQSSSRGRAIAGRAPAAAAAEKLLRTTGTTRQSIVASRSPTAAASPDAYSSTEPYVCSLGAPVLFTAPHGLKLKKGVGATQSARNHARERFTTEIVLKLAVKYAERQAVATTSASAAKSAAPKSASSKAAAVPMSASDTLSNSSASSGHPTQLASFMVWNYKTAAVDDPRHADPNFLNRRSCLHSAWHTMLHEWKAQHGHSIGEACPRLLHVDIHGKNDREGNMDIDVGMLPMGEEGCLSEEAVKAILERLCAELRLVFKGRTAVSSKSKKTFPITIEPNPVLHGYWGEDTVMTMSHQSALLGMTSLQFEIPKAVRTMLIADDELLSAFARAIFNTYDALIAAESAGPRRGDWRGDYFAGHGSAEAPLRELTVTVGLGVNSVHAMLHDLQRADASNVHGKSI